MYDICRRTMLFHLFRDRLELQRMKSVLGGNLDGRNDALCAFDTLSGESSSLREERDTSLTVRSMSQSYSAIGVNWMFWRVRQNEAVG